MEYIVSHMWQLWAVLAVLFAIAELSTGSLYVLCFAIGAVAAAIASLFGGVYAQGAVFIIISLVSIFAIRPVALRYLHRGEDQRKSGAEALIGRHGRVTEAIAEGGFGRVAIDGDDWKAQSIDGSTIAVGSSVEVLSIDSIIITVKQI